MGFKWPCMFWLVSSRVVQVGRENGDTYLWGSQYHPEFKARCIGIYLSDIGGNPAWAADVNCAEGEWTLARVLRVSVAELVHEIGTL